MQKWSRIVGFSLVAVLLLNIFHAFFLYQKKYNPVTLEYTVATDYSTAVWHTFTTNYSGLMRSKDTLRVENGNPVVVSTVLEAAEGIDHPAIYWSRADRGTFSISDVSLSSGKKLWKFDDIDKLISYSSDNVTSELIAGKLKNAATSQGNGWLMLEAQVFQNISKQKEFKPFHWITSLAMFVVFILLGAVFWKSISDLIKKCKIGGITALKVRMYLLCFWMLLLPFWPGASHIFLAIALASTIWHYAVHKKEFNAKVLLRFLPLWILFFAILFINTINHPSELSNDVADYSYFLLAPFLFLGLKRNHFLKLIRVLEVSVSIYVLLIITAIIERYLVYDVTYYFSAFFFNTINQYWHTSYLAVLMGVLLLFRAYRKGARPVYLFITLCAWIFMFLSQARLPMYLVIFLAGVLSFKRLTKRSKQVNRIIIAIISICIAIIMVKVPDYRKEVVDSILINDAQNEDVRPELWAASIAIFKEYTYAGVGRSKVRDVISENLSESSAIKFRRYNAHNQYLEFLIAYGLFIPLLFLIVLLFPIVKRHKTTTIFVVFFSLAMMVESYLSRQTGVLLFTFFYGLFMMYDYQDKKHIATVSK